MSMALGVWAWRASSLRKIGQDRRAVLDLVASGRLSEAEAPLRRWLGARPDDPEAHSLHARIALALDRPKEAAEAIDRARSLGAGPESLQRVEGLLLARRGRSAEAEPLLARVLGRSSEPEPEVAEALARILLESYRLKQAAIVLERWARDAPRDGRPYLWMTEVDRRIEPNLDVAIGHYREALRRDPNLHRARLELAEALREARRGEEAAREFEAYFARRPDDPAALVGAGRNALAMADLPTAIRHLDRALGLSPSNLDALKERAAVELQRGDGAAALPWLDKALKVDPFDAEAVYSRGLALNRLRRSTEAKAEQARAARLRDEQAQLLKTRERLQADPGNDDLRSEIARWMFEHGQPAQGVKWAESVLARRPGHAATHRLLADHYRAVGDAGRANFHRLRAAEGGSAP